MSELDIIYVTATHDVKLPINREKYTNGAGVGAGKIGPCRPTARSGRRRWSRRSAASYEIELTDSRVPVAALGILVDMPEVHAVRGIDLCPRIITPAGTASLRADSRKHDAFSLREVTWRVNLQASGITNRWEDCRVGSRITDNRVSVLIGDYVGHPAPHTVVAVG